MVHVVVAVLAVSAHTVQILEGVQIGNQLIDFVIGIKVGGIGLLDALLVVVQHILPAFQNPHAQQLGHGKVHPLIFAHVPVLVALGAEVFQSHPNRLLGLCHHVGRPVVEDLDTAQLHTHVLHIDPAVRHDVLQCFQLGFVFQGDFADAQANGDKVPVGKSGGDPGNLGGNVVHACHQILKRHGGDEAVGGNGVLLPVLLVNQLLHGVSFRMNLHNPAALADFAAHILKFLRGGFPQLAGAELGVLEFLNEGGLHMGILLALGQRLLQNVLQNGNNGQALYPLSAPVGGDVPGMAAPELFRVALKEHGVELAAKAVDVEILQRILVLFAHRGI